MENLEEKWKKLTLSDSELHQISIEEDFIKEESKKKEKTLVGKLHSEIIVSRDVLKNTMQKVWRTSRPFYFINVYPNIFVVKFE